MKKIRKTIDVIYYKPNGEWELRYFFTMSQALKWLNKMAIKYNKITIKKSWI